MIFFKLLIGHENFNTEHELYTAKKQPLILLDQL